ncbi:LOW QUALITY PROTEIN: tumor necrosis factor receptor superfamily member 13C [Geothlypis trichas]
MQELGSHSRSAMSSSGKAAIAPSCLSFECFDALTKSCIKCSDLFQDNTTEPTLAPTLSSTFLIFGVPVVVGLILVLAAVCVFLACKEGKQKKRKAADEEDKDSTSPLPSQDSAMPEGDGALNPPPCLHLAGSLKMLGPPRKARAKQGPCCQGNADGDIVLLSAVYSRPEECNHSFPLPATELGATALVPTKTTQNCTREETV